MDTIHDSRETPPHGKTESFMVRLVAQFAAELPGDVAPHERNAAFRAIVAAVRSE